ncbi:MAG: isochorismatase family protein [Patulibacter sp.]|nr:isochorismatase family protein [Patulibacter sp.]
MALPTIQPYSMPTAADLPAGGRVAWTLEPGRAALLVHDMQQYFVNAYDRTAEPIPALIANIRALTEQARALGIPVIYSAQPASQTLDQRGLLQDWWGDGIGDGPGEADIIDELAPAPGDTHLTKWRYSAFVKTDLLEQLRADGRDQLIVTGIYAHIGCLMTAAQAFMEEIQPFFVIDGVADFTRADHDMAISWAARRCGVTVTTEGALAQLGGGAVAAATVTAAVGSGAAAADGEPTVIRATGSAAGTMTPAAVRARLADLTEESLDDLGDEDDLADAGIDSIKLMGVIAEWQQAGFAVSFEELAEEPTIAAWAALLARAAAPAVR